MPPLEAWQRVLIDEGAISAGVHAYIACTDCHGGADVPDMAAAHEGLIPDPSAPPYNVCGTCHVNVQAAQPNSLHLTLAGYDTALYARSTPADHPALEEMQANHCNHCHATCGQCHISQPASVGGGLLNGHAVLRTPPMSRTCTGCHGSRVRDEYTGRNEGYPADLHFTRAGMNCVACHTGNEMHGVGMEGVTHRYDGPRVPTCESCHADSFAAGTANRYHTLHGLDVSCQVCHSVAYKNCANCHVQQSAEGIPYFQIDPSWMDFRIGINVNRTAERPWQYVLVRHVPIAPDSFEYYGENLLSNFDNRPTWVEATPHNIQRLTPQTQRCENCHGNPAIFLTEDAVLPEELLANRQVIVYDIPSLDLIERAEARGR